MKQSGKTEERIMNTWIDFTRRGDPANEDYVGILDHRLRTWKPLPDVFCFWTKDPGKVAELYREYIREMSSVGVIVLAQVTHNVGYDVLEPNVIHNIYGLGSLINTLGHPSRVRVRFDPIIPGFTTMEMFRNTCMDCYRLGIHEVTTNFIVPRYKGVGNRLRSEYGINVDVLSSLKRVEWLTTMVKIAKEYQITLNGCAEIYSWGLEELVPGMGGAGCDDPAWAQKFNHRLEFDPHPSRTGCRCVYTGDWGSYANAGGPRCPHQCVYCYAQ